MSEGVKYVEWVVVEWDTVTQTPKVYGNERQGVQFVKESDAQRSAKARDRKQVVDGAFKYFVRPITVNKGPIYVRA